MNKIQNITIVIEETTTGFSAFAKELEGYITVGDTVSEIKSNMQEVLGYHVEYLRETQPEYIHSIDDYRVEYEFVWLKELTNVKIKGDVLG